MKTKEEKCCKVILKFDNEMKKNLDDNPLRKSIMGYYGELIVAKEFKKRGFNVESKGNLTGYDLLIKEKKIEVRTSEVKSERAFPKQIRAWGWKLQVRNRHKKPKPIQYDYICLVKLYKNWEKYQIFMLSKQEVEKVDITYFSGYQTVARAIYLFKTPILEALKFDKHKMITKKCIEFNQHPNQFRIKWKRLNS